MAAPFITTRILQNTQTLIVLYNRNPQFREAFDHFLLNPRVVYQGLPLKFYVRVIAIISPKYNRYEREVRQSSEKYKELFTKFYEDRQEFNKLRGWKNFLPLPQDQIVLVEQITKLPEGDPKKAGAARLLERKLDQTQPQTPAAAPEPGLKSLPLNFFNFSKSLFSQKPYLNKPEIPGFLKDLASLGKRLVIRFSPNLVSGVIGGIVGGFFAGPGGGVIGATLGGLLPQFIKSGITQSFLGGSAGTVLKVAGGALTATNPVGWVILAFRVKYIIFGLLALFLFPIFKILLETNSLLPPFKTQDTLFIPYQQTTCPDTSTNKNTLSCRYLNPKINIFETNISQEAINSYIAKYSPIFISAKKGNLEEFTKRVNYIMEKSKQARLNPILFLGYWKTESLFSTQGIKDLGCQGSNFYEQVRCALGIEEFGNPSKNPIANCARSESAESLACQTLKSIRASFDQTHPINYPIRTFDDFAEAYGPYDDFLNGEPTNCTHTYNLLIGTAKELGACQESFYPLMGILASCPLLDVRIINCGSYASEAHFNQNICTGGSPSERGHCGTHYKTVFTCSPDSRRAHAIDIKAETNERVYLPFINDQKLIWFFAGSYNVAESEGGGYGQIFTTRLGNDSWVLHLVHVNKDIILSPKDEYQSGDFVAMVYNDHLHVNIGKNPLGENSGKGWFDPETLGMCVF